MEIVIVVVVVVLCVAVSWGFSLRRRMDKHAQEESDPELRQAYIDAQRQMDRGRASSHGFCVRRTSTRSGRWTVVAPPATDSSAETGIAG